MYPAWQEKIREAQTRHRDLERIAKEEREAAEKALQKEMESEVRKYFGLAGLELPERDTPEWEIDGYRIRASREQRSAMIVSVSLPIPGADIDKPFDWFDDGYQVQVSRSFAERELRYSFDVAVRLANVFDELPKERDAAIARNAAIEQRNHTTEIMREDVQPGRIAPYWVVETLVDDPTSRTGDCSEQIADYLNSGWEIVAINFGQCHVDDGEIDYTRVTTLKKLITPSPAPEPEKSAGVELGTETAPLDPNGEGNNDAETVIEFEPIAEVIADNVALPANMRVLDVDGKPLVQFADGVSKETPYEEAIKRVDVDAEQLGAIHEAETEKRVNERLEAFRSGEITFEEAVAAAGIRAAQAVKDDLKFEAIRAKYGKNPMDWSAAAPGFARF
jgi:hypothetical protein